MINVKRLLYSKVPKQNKLKKQNKKCQKTVS